jgi:hypothetical protein
MLIVATNITNALSTELDQFKTNLVGDGWTVLRTNVPPHDDTTWANNTNAIVTIRNTLNGIYDSSPATNKLKAVLLIGRVPIPYSGNLNPDTHGFGAFPSDAYYAELTSQWTDTNSYTTSDQRNNVRWQNVAGDGKYDQNELPSSLEIAVGRVDFANMPIFTNPPAGVPVKYEVDLLRQYLNKDHNYRHKLFTVQERVMDGYFVNNSDLPNRDGQVNGSRFFGLGSGQIVHGSFFTKTVGQYPNPTDRLNNSSHWGFYSKNSNPFQIGVYWNTHFVDPANEPLTSFAWLLGSYLGDWDYPDQAVRALLGTPNYTLAAVWGLGVTWGFERIALGDVLGDGLLRAANENPNDEGFGPIYMDILGDPALRLHVTEPVTGLVFTTNGTNVTLSWSHSTAPNPSYFVYRSTSGIDGAFSRLTPTPLNSNTFTDVGAPSGAKLYQVRALSLVVSGSGSYTNLSQGIFINVQ